MTLPYKSKDFKTSPISPTCQVVMVIERDAVDLSKTVNITCNQPTTICYPAFGSGWMALCENHGKKHLPHAFRIEDVIRSGEKFE